MNKLAKNNDSNLRDFLYIIDMIRIDTNQPALVDTFALEMAKRWEFHFKERKIDISLLGKLYKAALDFRATRDYNLAFSIEDILRAWNSYKERELHKSLYPVYDSGKNCSKCNGTGTYEQMYNGKTIEIYCKH